MQPLWLVNSWGLCPRSGSVFPFPWASKPARHPGQRAGDSVSSPVVDGWREGCSSGPRELKASSSSGISLFIEYEGQTAQPLTVTPASGVGREGKALKPQAKLVPLAIACSLRPGASIGSRPPGHRLQPGRRPDATDAHGLAPGNHLQVKRRVRTAFSPSAQPNVLLEKGAIQAGHTKCCGYLQSPSTPL